MRPDPRSAEPDLNARQAGVTQKISREALEEALKRTKSGTRRAVRSEHELPDDFTDARRERDSLPGPRDDEDNPHAGPQVTIVRIDSVEMDVFDPPTPRALLERAARPTPTPMGAMMSPGEIRIIPTPFTPLVERKRFGWATERVHITPRTAFVAGLAVAVFVLVAACIGFFAGRIAPGAPGSPAALPALASPASPDAPASR